MLIFQGVTPEKKGGIWKTFLEIKFKFHLPPLEFWTPGKEGVFFSKLP